MGTPQSAQTRIITSQEEGLGAELTTFPARNQTYNRVVGLAFGCSIVLASIFFFFWGFSEMFTAIRLHGRAVVLLHAPSLLLLLAFLPVSVVILMMTGWNWNNRLSLHERGIVSQQGLKKRIWRWESTTRMDTRITHIKFGGNIVEIRVRLILADSHEKLVIRNQYQSMSELVQEIRTRVMPVLTEWAEDQLNQNKPLVFHKELTATKEGLLIRGEQVDWMDIDSPKFKNLKLILLRKLDQEKVFHANLNQVTNLDLLVYLIKYPPKISG